MIYFILFILGASIVSFINAFIYRAHYNINFSLFERSKCEYCHQKLLYFQLIPIISALVLKHRCYFCDHRFPYWYTITEFLGGLFLITIYHDSIIYTLWISLFYAILYTNFVSDLLYFEIYPLPFIFASLFWIIIGHYHFNLNLYLEQFIFYQIICNILFLFYKKYIGYGDIIFLSFFILIIPIVYLPYIIFIATTIALIIIIIFPKYNKLPFIPFIIIAFLIIIRL